MVSGGPDASAASSVMRGRKRLPPAASIRRTASVISALSVENVGAEEISTAS